MDGSVCRVDIRGALEAGMAAVYIGFIVLMPSNKDG